MLKMMGKGEKNNKPITLIVFGLSHRNLDLLREGKPIKFSGDTCGLDASFEFVIFAGESERQMQRDFVDMIGPQTKLHIDPRLKD